MARAARTKETIDLKTGEVILKESWYHYKGKGVYWFKVDFAFIGYIDILTNGDIRVLFEVCRLMSVENIFMSNKDSIQIIADETNTLVNSVRRCITRLIKVGLMKRGTRGVMYVNPNIISYGSGENLIKTRERFKNVIQTNDKSEAQT